jgi:putative transposase
MHIFRVGRGKAFSSGYGKPAWLNTTKWKALRGNGRASTEPRERPRWRPSAQAPTPRTGGKKGRKRSLLVDARGIPLSLVASGANVHDVKLLTITLDKMVCKRPKPRKGQPQRLCADAGYKGDPATKAVLARRYWPHIKQRKEEAHAKLQKPAYKARRWVVERTHSWLNRFRKLLVSFEKTEASFVALLTLAAALICWRQSTVIYG